jgi:hypothetical protein
LGIGGLPTVRIGDYRISRLIIGGNPFRGFSHISRDVDLQMLRYYTDERILQALFDASHCGVNAMIMRGDEVIMRVVRKFREAGGTLLWIAQTAPEIEDWRANISEIMRYSPIGIYLHGGHAEKLWKSGRIDLIGDVLGFIHDQGVMAGVASHTPELLRDLEDRGMDADFYMACFYNPRRPPGELYLPEDRERMCETIRDLPKPCIGFKVLAAGRNCGTKEELRKAITYALEHVKPTDAIAIGVWQEKGNQIAEDAEIVREWHEGSGSL